MRYIFLFLLCIATVFADAQNEYDADKIPASLKARANAIVRNESTKVEMLASDNVVLSVKKAITVMNANGENHARLVLHYDKSISIKSIKGEVYNELGSVIGKFNQNGFKDESAIQSFSMFEDNRIKHYLPAVNAFPYTVVYEYEIRYKQNLSIPEWFPKRASDIAIEKSSYTFVCKTEDRLRIDSKNTPQPDTSTTDKFKILTWNITNVNANRSEIYSPSLYDYFPRVKVAPEKFSYFGKSGTYSNWQELGKWIYNDLVKDRQELPIETIRYVKDLVKNATSDREKAKLIYNYLQEKTRYISIQLGIGGLQPFKALDVDRLGYGDCKALVNYMQSLLKAVDIESYYCVVEAGTEKVGMKPDFASVDQGNHIILCLPLKNDTTWLECTNQKIPFGYLGDFTDDRTVLACKQDGGQLLKTPKYSTNNSLQLRIGHFSFDENGNLAGQLKTTFSGSQYENHEYISYQVDQDKEKSLKRVYDINNIDFERIQYDKDQDTQPLINENLQLTIRNYGSINDDKLYFVPNAFNQQKNIGESNNRKFPIRLARGYTDIDSLVYQLPKNILPLLPNIEKQLDTKFGSYNLTVKIIDDKLYFYRKMALNDGVYPAEDFEKFTDFLNGIAQNDKLKLFLSLKK